MIEEWRPVVGFEGLYEVSDLGRVRSLDRIRDGRNHWGPFRFKRPGALMKGRLDRDGYVRVLLSNYGVYNAFVHQLVLEAFVGPRPPGTQTRHLDGVRTHNVPSNLAWGTAIEQCEDKARHGTQASCPGEKNGCAKLTEAEVLDIRRRCASGEKQEAVGQEFGVTQSSISMIVNRRVWAHVE